MKASRVLRLCVRFISLDIKRMLGEGRWTYVGDAVDVAVFRQLLDLLAVHQLRIVCRLIFFAVLVEEVDDVETFVLVVAYQDVQSEAEGG